MTTDPAAIFTPSIPMKWAACGRPNKPNWYLPTWGNATDDELFRLEQYLCFAQNLQGLAKPPDPSMNNPYAANTAHSMVETQQARAAAGDHLSAHAATQGRSGHALLLVAGPGCADQVRHAGQLPGRRADTRGACCCLYVAGKMLTFPSRRWWRRISWTARWPPTTRRSYHQHQLPRPESGRRAGRLYRQGWHRADYR